MAGDHAEQLATSSAAYVEARRAFVQAVLIARSDGYSYEDIARITGLNELAIRRLVRPGD